MLRFATSLLLMTVGLLASAAEDRSCQNRLLDKEHVQRRLREDHDYTESAIAEAAYVEVELEIFSREDRVKPALLVHAPGRARLVFVGSREGGRRHRSVDSTTFVKIGTVSLAIEDSDGGWRLTHTLPQRSRLLRSLVETHADAMESLIRRRGCSADDILRAEVFSAEEGFVLMLVDDRHGRTERDWWFARARGRVEFGPIDGAFPTEDDIVKLDENKFLVRLPPNEGRAPVTYETVTSLIARAGEVAHPSMARLLPGSAKLLTRMTLPPFSLRAEDILNAEVHWARYESDPSRLVAVLKTTPATSRPRFLAVVDPSYFVHAHETHFRTTRYLMLDDGSRLNVQLVDGEWRFKRFRPDGTLTTVREALNRPLGEEYFKALGAKLR